MKTASRYAIYVLVFAFFVLSWGVATSEAKIWQPAAVLCSVAAAIGLGSRPTLAGYRFTFWIIAAFIAALIYPERFLHLGPISLTYFELPAIDLQNKWIMLVVVQLVMFGMGTKMGYQDFAGVAKMPFPVLIGIGLQFLIMPLTGYALAKAFDFPAEIAAGVVLIGSCSSGLASNVMCYLAGANLALSITLTSVATLLAPLATTFWMKQLAGEFVPIDALSMLVQIVKIVIVPIGAALLHDYMKHASPRNKTVIQAIAGLSGAFCLVAMLDATLWSESVVLAMPDSLTQSLLMLCGAITFAVAYHHLARVFPWLDRNIHVVSMFGIIFFTAVTTAAGRDSLLVAGLALVCAAIIHNLTGYTLGYTLSRLAGLDRNSALTVALEVGMQNGGLASGLAAFMGKLGTVGLAAAVFSPWMNVSGSILAMQVRKSRLPEGDAFDESAIQDPSQA